MIATLEEGNLITIISMAILRGKGRYTITKLGEALDLYNGDKSDEDGDMENGSSLYTVSK